MHHRDDDYPRSLRDPLVRERRRAMLREPHAAKLVEFVDSLRDRLPGDVQDFDPLDGCADARVLFLLEKPGPMTDPARKGRPGSGFISRNNDDPTAEATFRFMQVANLDRRDTVIWNLIPWWDGHISFTGADLSAALNELEQLLDRLPRLHTAVLVGRTAGRARSRLRSLRVIESAHPSPQVRAASRAMWDAIPGIWRAAGLPP